MILTSEIQWNLFRQVRVSTAGGHQYVGKMVRYDQENLVLEDEDGQDIAISREDVMNFRRVRI